MCTNKPELIVEIGPGQGALTAWLLARAARVVAVEIDPTMIALLGERFAGEEKLTVVPGDVLQTDLSQWGLAVLAGNIPYYITSPILDRIFAARAALREAVLLVQREVAQRLVAEPGSRDYGLLSVRTQVYAEAKYLFKVPPGAFSPPPNVESAVVRLVMRDAVEDQEKFLEFAARCFGHKRKTLRNNLIGFYGKELVEAQPEAGLRGEQLSIPMMRDLMTRLENG